MKRTLLSLFTALSLVFIAVGSVEAHTPKVTFTCEEGLTVDLTKYNTRGDGTNGVVVELDQVFVASDNDFGSSFFYNSGPQDPYLPHYAHVQVAAWDDDDVLTDPFWSIDKFIDFPACKQATPSPTPEPTPEPTPSATPNPSATPLPSSTPTITLPPTDTDENVDAIAQVGTLAVLAWLFVSMVGIIAGVTAFLFVFRRVR